MSKISSYFLLPTSIWLLAFLCGLFFVNDWQLELFAAAFLLLTLWACFKLSEKAEHGFIVPKTPVLGILGAFWLLCFFSVLWSQIPFISLIAFCLASVLPLTFFTFVLSGRDEEFSLLAHVVPVVFAGLAVWALIQFYFFNVEFEGQAHHPLANPNSLAALFNLGLFPALGVMMTAQKKWLAHAALGFAILLFAGITVTSSRGALMSGGIAFVLLLALNPAAVKGHWKCLLIFAASALALYFMTVFGELKHAHMVDRMGRVIASGDVLDLANNRENIWSGVVALIQEHWLLGTGIGTFFLFYPTYRIADEVTGAYMAHSDPLQFWAELGFAGPILFYALGIAIIYRTWRAVSKLEKGSAERVQILSVVSAFFAVILHTHFTFNLYIVSILFVFGLLLAWWFRKTHEILEDDTAHFSFPSFIPVSYRAGFLVIPLVMLAGMFASFMASEHVMKRAKAEIYNQDLTNFSNYVHLADQLSMGTNFRPYEMVVTVPMSVLEVNKKTLPEDEQKRLFDEAWGFLNKAEALNPQNPAVPYYRGYLGKIGTEFYPEDALGQEAYYLEALGINPMHLGARMGLMEIYQARDDMERYDDIIDGGVGWTYKSRQAVDFYREVTKHYILTGQIDKYKAVREQERRLQKRLKASRARSQQSMSERLFGGE